jgi:AcrR family transcriptional regulator
VVRKEVDTPGADPAVGGEATNDRSYYFQVRKGDVTRERIIEAATAVASRMGLVGLTIGALANELGLSKSGLFGHFGSREELQLRVLEGELSRFEREVFHPAIQKPRGEPRIRALFENWLRWQSRSRWPGGCIIVSASVEFDDVPGALHEATIEAQNRLLQGIARAARIAVEVGHFRKELDPEQFAFQLYSIVLGQHFLCRVRRDAKAEARARAAFEQLLKNSRP